MYSRPDLGPDEKASHPRYSYPVALAGHSRLGTLECMICHPVCLVSRVTSVTSVTDEVFHEGSASSTDGEDGRTPTGASSKWMTKTSAPDWCLKPGALVNKLDHVASPQLGAQSANRMEATVY